MSAEFKIKLEVDDTQANQSIAAINTRIAQIGSRTGGSSGLTSLNAQLQQIAATNPAVGNVIRSIGGTGTSAATSAGHVGGLANAIRGVGSAAQGAGAATSGLFGSIGASAQSALTNLSGMQGSLAGIATAGGALVATAIVGGLVAIGTAAVNASAKFEAYRASLTTVLGSSTAAAGAFDNLIKFAAQTPFSLDQSVQGFIKLKALGLAPTQAAMTSYGNTASAMGKDLNQMIEAVADAATGEFERLKEFGIKSKVQGSDVAFTFQGVTTKIGNNSAEIQKYLQGIGNTNFAGAMEAQMKTFNGATSNLSDTVTQTLAKIGDGLNAPLAGIINMITSGLSAITPLLAGIGNMFGGLISGIGSVIGGIGSMFSGLSAGGSGSISILEALTGAVNLIGQGFQVAGSIIGSVLGFVGNLVGQVAGMIRGSLGAAVAWIGVSFESGGRSWGNSIMGVLRAVKTVASLMPQIFSVVVSDIMGMFRTLGGAISALLTGNWAQAKALASKPLFANTGKALSAAGRIGVATYRDEKGASAATDRLFGRVKSTSGSLDSFAGATPKATPSAGKGNDAKSKADEEAKKAADRIKKEREYFQTLDQTAKVAAMMPQAAEQYNKELELRKIRGDGELKDSIQLSALDQKRIADALRLKDLGEITRSIAVASQAADIDGSRLKERIAATSGVTVEKAAENLAIEEKLWPFKKAALEKGIDLADTELQKQLAILAAKEGQNYQTQKGIDLAARGVEYGNSAIKTDGTRADKIALATKTRDDTLAALKAGQAGMSTTAFQAGVVKAGREFREEVIAAGQGFAGRLGSTLSNIGNVIGGKLGALIGKGGDFAKSIGDFTSVQTDYQNQVSSLFSNPSSKLAQGLGKAVGGAMAGLQIGESISSLAKSIGLKQSATGAKLGGAIGGAAFGPIGAAVGGFLGGTIGGLFKKAKYGTASLTGTGDAAISGNSTKGASGAAGSVQEGLANLANQLGGMVGAYSLSIGQYKGKWRVADDAISGKLKASKAGVTDFGKDGEDAAIAYAIKNAISDGAITGLSPVVTKALKSLGADAAIEFAKSWKDMMDDFDAITDPVGAAIRNITSPIEAMRASLLKIGDTSAELTKLDQYRAKKLSEVMKEQTQTFTDLLETLNGEATGTTALTSLTRDLDKFAGFKSDISAGKAIDQNDFSSIVNKIIGETTAVYGNATAESQGIFAMLRDTTLAGQKTVADQITAAINGAANDNGTVSAIDAQTSAITDRQDAQTSALVLNNSYQSQILEAVQGLGSVIAAGGGGGGGRPYDLRAEQV